MITHDVVVVGGGLAGLRAALEIKQSGLDVVVISKVYPVRSHSCMAQGGLNAALGNHPDGRDDSPDRHAFDTIKGSDFLADQDGVEVLTRDVIEIVYEMERWGCPFSRMPDGRIAQRPFGGAGFPRTCYGADRTGLYLLQTLYEQTVKHGLRFYDEFLVLSLVVEEGRCHGVVVLEVPTGALHGVLAKAVIFATGGAGRVFGRTSNSLTSTGSGAAIAYRAGVPLKDMEFFQFHPTTLVGINLTITEGLRGQGAHLLNARGERFMGRYVSADVMERAPRDITARAIRREIEEGRGIDGGDFVHLDARHLGADVLRERYPGVLEACRDFRGIDPTWEPIPVQPGAHYTMGGIDTNLDCETAVEGFYAAGECACVSVHGANRLGGNSLAEAPTFGRRAGRAAVGFLRSRARQASSAAVARALDAAERRLRQLFEGTGTENPPELRRELNQVMDEKVAIFRNGEHLEQALETIRSLAYRFRRSRRANGKSRFNFDLIWILELESMLLLAEVIAAGALARRESRGSHARTDYPNRDDANWLRHTLATWTSEGPTLEYRPVTVTRWPVQERRY